MRWAVLAAMGVWLQNGWRGYGSFGSDEFCFALSFSAVVMFSWKFGIIMFYVLLRVLCFHIAHEDLR